MGGVVAALAGAAVGAFAAEAVSGLVAGEAITELGLAGGATTFVGGFGPTVSTIIAAGVGIATPPFPPIVILPAACRS